MPRQKTVPSPNIPLFEQYSVSQLADLLGYSEMYLLYIKDGLQPVNRRFMDIASRILQRPKEELFGDFAPTP